MPTITRFRPILLVARLWLVAGLAGLLAACGGRLEPGTDAATQAVFDQVKRHDFAAVEARLPPRLRTAVTDTRLQVEAAMIPDQPPQSVKLVSFSSLPTPAGRDTLVTREYFYPDRLLLVSTAIREQAGQPARILGFTIQPFSKAALAVGRFSLAHKSPTQYLLLGLAAAIPLMLVAALAGLARDKKARWKWAWTLFILVGFGKLSVNWTTGALLVQPLSVILLGASVARAAPDVSPWFVSVSVPLGALIYLWRRWFSPIPDEPE